MIKAKMTSLEDINAKRNNHCTNPFCNEFCELSNQYKLCINCFKKLVSVIGNIHQVFNYDEFPPAPCLSKERALRLLVLAEHTEQMDWLYQVSTYKKSRGLTVKKGDSSE